jgi:hypothetical protein
MCWEEYWSKYLSKDFSVGVGSEAFTIGKLGDTVLPPIMTDNGGVDTAAAVVLVVVDDDMIVCVESIVLYK